MSFKRNFIATICSPWHVAIGNYRIIWRDAKADNDLGMVRNALFLFTDY
jgi:hypothetical protein